MEGSINQTTGEILTVYDWESKKKADGEVILGFLYLVNHQFVLKVKLFDHIIGFKCKNLPLFHGYVVFLKNVQIKLL